jgi:hypothetical protein
MANSEQKATNDIFVCVFRIPSEDDEDLPSKVMEYVDDSKSSDYYIFGIFEDKKEALRKLVEEIRSWESIDVGIFEVLKAPKNQRLHFDLHYERKSDKVESKFKAEKMFEIAVFEGELLKYGDWRSLPAGVINVRETKKRKTREEPETVNVSSDEAED